MLILVTGGAASGKSAHAERLHGRQIQARALRRDKGFETVERPLGLAGLELPRRYDGILLEDLGNLLANELFDPAGAGEAAFGSTLAGIARLQDCCETLVVVSNEVFSDGLAYPSETAAYIRTLGRLHAALAARADAVYESVCGILLPLKGEKGI